VLKRLAILLAALLLPALAQAQGSYKIAPGDRLTVTVLEDANLNSQVLVRPDGRVTLPIVGSISVVGRTPEQVQAMVRQRLAGSFNVTPTVTVSLAATALPFTVQPENIYVLGEVAKPGVLQTTPPQKLNVLQALAQAGGLTQFARGSAIQIRRVNPKTGEETVFSFDYDELEAGRRLSANITLRDGDVVFVPERGLFD